MNQENITLILLAVIGLVFLIDFIKNNSKKSIDKSVEKYVKKQESSKSSYTINGILGGVLIFIIYFLVIVLLDPPDRLPFYYNTGHLEAFYLFLLTYSYVPIILTIYINHKYFLERKKNISLSLILIPLLKVITHFLLFNEEQSVKVSNTVNRTPKNPFDMFSHTSTSIYEVQPLSLGHHFEVMFTERLELFIPVTIVFLIVVWFFNDKIKPQ